MKNLIIAGFDVAEDRNAFHWFATTTRIGEEIWARLAHKEYRWNKSVRHGLRSHGGFAPSNDLDRIKGWAKMLKDAAEWDEGSNSPNVSVVDENFNGVRTLHLNWFGSFTNGRQVGIEFFPNDEGGIAYVRYNTGTGKPSSFLEEIFISAKAEAEDVIIPAEMATQIRSNLCLAYGGYSQFGTEDIVKAVCGHVRNGTLLRREKAVALSVIAAALLQEEERWEGTGPPTPSSEEWPTILLEAERIVGECWEAQRTNQGARGYGMPKGVVRAPAVVD